MNDRTYDAVIFDLDGTLLDTLADLTSSVNAMMRLRGMPTYTKEQVRSFVGNGIRRLMMQVVPGGETHPDFEEIFADFGIYYKEHCMDETVPYAGIMQLLEMLCKNGYKLGIVSNKADAAVKKLNKIFFEGLVEVAIGEKPEIRRKPAPDTVFQALKELGVSKERAVYVGDSEVDIQTAAAAGMDAIIVTWGFRDRALLLAQGASPERLADHVDELKKFLL